LLRRLASDGVLPTAQAPGSDAELRGAIHRFLCKTPAALVGISLDDLAGEVEPVNLPGVEPDRFPSWTRRMRMSLEQMRRDDGVKRALGCERRR
jgi:4-alpha-glucanotransferase